MYCVELKGTYLIFPPSNLPMIVTVKLFAACAIHYSFLQFVSLILEHSTQVLSSFLCG